MRRLVLALLLLLAVPAAGAPSPGFGWPLSGTPLVDRGFEPPSSAYGVGHRGVDLRGALGQQVLSAGPGRVTYAGLLAGRGVVTVTHAQGLRTTYEPVAATVAVGALVARGTVLGHLTGGHASCRPGLTCLHWGLLRGAVYLDPLSLLRTPRLRLLPVDAPTPAAPGVPAPVAAPAPQPTAHGPQGTYGGRAAGRSLAGAAALTSLALGVIVLASRTRPAPPPAPAPVDLRAERAKRRAA
jgi:hypothetical protein